MNEEYENDLLYEQEAKKRRERREKRRRRERNMKITLTAALLLCLALAIGLAAVLIQRDIRQDSSRPSTPSDPENSGSGVILSTPETGEEETANPIQVLPETELIRENAEQTQTGTLSQGETAGQTETTATKEPETVPAQGSNLTADELLKQANLLAAGYDYDGAIALLKSAPDASSNEAVTAAATQFEESKNACVAVDVTTVPHIFYHSLINDPASAFNVSVLGQSAVDGMNAWMTTVDEFDRITQQMYDNGYVFVRLRDLVVESTDENGNVHFEPNTNLMLPPDKKPVVLSVDDLSYYHSYEAASYPDKLVLDENGDVKCHYVKPDGSEEIGDFDVVPRLNTFLDEHPDASYKGARGLIALTGYNGVFGYRTDVDYRDRLRLLSDQEQWLAAHPEFDWETDVAEAKKIAEALKEEGWEFASHTWGHLSVTGKTAQELKVDNEKWVNTVQNIVGPVDTIIFAHGNDIGDWHEYSSDNEKYRYFKSAGYHFFCNVDSSSPYWVQITGEYVRQGRIDLDGYQLYQASQGLTTVLDGMFTASEVFDSSRPTPVIANGEA